MHELPQIIPSVITPAALFAAMAPPIPSGFTWVATEEPPPVPSTPAFDDVQRETFNGWKNDAYEPEEIADPVVVEHIHALIAWRKADDAYRFRQHCYMEAGWRWFWARKMLDAAPAAALIPSHSYIVEQGELDNLDALAAAPRPILLDRALEAAAVERARQIHELGYSAAHDDEHDKGELARAAAWYAIPVNFLDDCEPDAAAAYAALWPKDWTVPESVFDPTPAQRKRELEKAIGLLAAEWDRLDRVERRL